MSLISASAVRPAAAITGSLAEPSAAWAFWMNLRTLFGSVEIRPDPHTRGVLMKAFAPFGNASLIPYQPYGEGCKRSENKTGYHQTFPLKNGSNYV